MTLDEAALEKPVLIVGFSHMEDCERARLSGLGLRVGTLVTKLIFTPLRDPVECLVGPQLLALERGLLKRIRVEEVPT